MDFIDSQDVRFTLRGANIAFDKVADAVRHFEGIVKIVSAEQRGDDEIKWVVSDLATGSATWQITPEAETQPAIRGALEGIAEVGHALRSHTAIKNRQLATHAYALTTLLDSDITAIEIAVLDQDIEITSPSYVKTAQSIMSYGSIEGDVLAMSARGGETFTLYDNLYNKAVVCHIEESQEEQVKPLYHRRARVEGLVSRDPDTGRPTDIHDITSITPVEYTRGDYEMARGLFPTKPGDPSPEELIRRVRDAW